MFTQRDFYRATAIQPRNFETFVDYPAWLARAKELGLKVNDCDKNVAYCYSGKRFNRGLFDKVGGSGRIAI